MDPGRCLFCINRSSGGGAGVRLAALLERRLGPGRVADLASAPPAQIAERCRGVRTVVACGGDGTAAWMLGLLEDLPPTERPPVAILPLGTGNDLARCLGWPLRSPRRARELDAWLRRMAPAVPCRIDAWALLMPTGSRSFYNYCSLGEDAAVALAFDRLRRLHPVACRGGGFNKALYGIIALGAKPIAVARAWAGGEPRPPAWTRCLVASNIPSYAGGSRLDRRIDPADGRLDLHALGPRPVQGLALAGLRRPRRLGRVDGWDFTLRHPLPMQLDGEAFVGPAGGYAVRRRGEALLLRVPA